MTADGGYNFQASIKYGQRQEGMVNIRASDPDEAQAWINVAEQLAGPLNALAAAYNPPKETGDGVEMLRKGLGAEVDGVVCEHGNMVLKSGGYGQKQWSAWMCPAPQGDPTKCQPIDAKTMKPWPKR